MHKKMKPFSFMRIIYYTLMVAIVLFIAIIGYITLTKQDDFSKERVTKLLSREWKIEAFEDTTTNSFTEPSEIIQQERFIFYPDGRALILGKETSAFSWYYTEAERTVTLISMDENNFENRQDLLFISEEKLILKAPTTIVHMVPVK